MPSEPSKKRPRTKKEKPREAVETPSPRPARVLKRPAAADREAQLAQNDVATASTPGRRVATPSRNRTKASTTSFDRSAIGDEMDRTERLQSIASTGHVEGLSRGAPNPETIGSTGYINGSSSGATNPEQCLVQVPQAPEQKDAPVVSECPQASASAMSPKAVASMRERAGDLRSAPAGHNDGVAFLRLSVDCSPSKNVERLVYLDKSEVSFGRMPSNSVILDSSRFPLMISRVHGRVQRAQDKSLGEWIVVNSSVNGVYVNDQAIGEGGHHLQNGDIVRFGRKVSPPEFEFVFEEPTAVSADVVQEQFAEQARRIVELERQLEAERDQEKIESQQRGAARPALDVADIRSELICSICRDWVVHASTIECAHSFCWSCIDQWLRQKKFECPVCRHVVTREPVRSHTIEAIVHKTVDRGGEESRSEYQDRVRAAEENQARLEKLHHELEASMTDALKKGVSFPQIEANWGKRQKDLFQQDVKDYSGSTRETYCRLRNLTVQWVHSADDSKLNQALHNLGLQAFVSSTDEDIRKRLLMFLRYG